MLAARADQENFVHGQQTAAAAKPLNQGLRGLTAKTPGHKVPKTPFKVPLNDENAPFQAGKSVLKTNNGKVGTVGKKVTLDKNAFVTPAGPKNRQALGAKTTNAKANAFRTPGPRNAEPSPTKTQQKTGSPRLRRPKVKVLQSEPVVDNVDDDDYEIEYMPPRGEPLKDHPSEDEFGPTKTFPHLLPANLTRGWNEVYMNPADEHGVHFSDRERAARRAQAEKLADTKLQQQVDALFAENEAGLFTDLSLPPPTKAAKAATSASLARKAVSALAGPAKGRRLVPAATAAKARAPGGLNARKTRQPVAPASNASPTRFAAANAASRSTLGYAQGRAVSQKVRKPATSVFRDDRTAAAMPARSASAVVAARTPSEETFDELARDVVAQLRMQELAVEDDGEDGELLGRASACEDEDEDEEDFQLPLPSV